MFRQNMAMLFGRVEKYKTLHNKCIDSDLMIDEFSEDKELINLLVVEIKQADLFSGGEVIKTKNLKDKAQREDLILILYLCNF